MLLCSGLIISPDEMNILKTVIIAPMTSKGFDFIFRPKIKFENKSGLVLLDQIRAIDKSRIVKIIGKVDKNKAIEISKILQQNPKQKSRINPRSMSYSSFLIAV